jgi:hypothetical protein
MVTSRTQRLHAYFLTLAARRRELAQKASNAELADSHLRFAAEYEALAGTFSDLNQRQLAKDRGTVPHAGEVGRLLTDDPF